MDYLQPYYGYDPGTYYFYEEYEAMCTEPYERKGYAVYLTAALLESPIKFKQGLRSRWQNTFTSIHSNYLVVYTDETKSIELFRFFPKTSWVSFSPNSEKGLFVLNEEKNSTLFLFETGSELMLRTWLKTMKVAGWMSTAVDFHSNYHNDHPREQWLYSSISLSNSLNCSEKVKQRPPLMITSLNERSSSLPSIVHHQVQQTLYPNKSSTQTHTFCAEDKRKKPKAYSPLAKLHRNSDMIPLLPPSDHLTPSLRSGVSESGYCSKESLLMTENEKQMGNISIQDRMKDINRQAFHLQDLSSSNASSVFADEKMVENNAPYRLKSGPRTNSKKSQESIGEIFDEKGILQVANNNNFEDERNSTDPETTPKIEKKASVSQMISNIKSKFGSTAARKKGKKNGKRSPTSDSFASRLLWNVNGEWFDRWFIHQNGTLFGSKDSTATTTAGSPEVSIDVRSSTLTCYSSNDVLRRLNLFQLATKNNQTHVFVAWNEDEYVLWIDALTAMVKRKQELYGLKLENLEVCNADDEGGEIIPYERALSTEQRKTNSSSSDTSTAHARVDSIDSGNDGDESGLESSMSSNNKLSETRKKLDKERKTRSSRTPSFNENLRQSLSRENGGEPSPDEVDYAQRKPELCSELSRQLSRESTSTENEVKSPGVELPMLLDEKDVIDTASKKPKRASFKKWSIFDSKSDKSKTKKQLDTLQAKADNSIISASSSPRDIVNPIKRQSREERIEHEAGASLLVDESPSVISRPNSLNISLVEGSVDSNMVETTWDVFGRFKKMSVGSEDDISDTCSVPSIIDDPKRDEFEENLREETLLRKRRNSLTLERGQIVIKLDSLKDINNNNVKKTSHKQSTVSIPDKTDLVATNTHKEKILNLERRVEDIDSQIEIIDKHIDLRFEPYKQKKSRALGPRKSTGQQLRSRLKLTGNKSKQLENINSMSVESLSSSASHGSSLGHDSPSAFTTNKTFDPTIKNSKIVHKKISDCSDISGASSCLDKSQFTGIEELLITTQKLESSNNAKLNQPLSTSDKWRSKSLGSVDLIRSKPQRKEVRIGSSSAVDSSDIIEDFEKFSEMLSNQMKERQNSTPTIIEV